MHLDRPSSVHSAEVLVDEKLFEIFDSDSVMHARKTSYCHNTLLFHYVAAFFDWFTPPRFVAKSQLTADLKIRKSLRQIRDDCANWRLRKWLTCTNNFRFSLGGTFPWLYSWTLCSLSGGPVQSESPSWWRGTATFSDIWSACIWFGASTRSRTFSDTVPLTSEKSIAF